MGSGFNEESLRIRELTLNRDPIAGVPNCTHLWGQDDKESRNQRFGVETTLWGAHNTP